MKLKATEKGFTLIELLVTIGIAAFVVGAASMTIITMMRLTPKTNNWAIALHQVQNAGYWISRDVMMSQTILVDSDPGTPTFLTLTVPQPSTVLQPYPPPKTIVYQFEDMSGGLKRLMRSDQGVGQIMIAEYIYYDPLDDPNNSTIVTTTPQEENGWVLTLRIAAVISGDEKVIRRYEATQRVPP
jgi:prepilin-type N-terminal cleavage/methylation domain-containing protein